jgi:hypothetical protein
MLMSSMTIQNNRSIKGLVSYSNKHNKFRRNTMKKTFVKKISFSLIVAAVILLGIASVYAGGGSGGGGGGIVGPNPLPQTAPAADVIYRESFGPAINQLRPVGTKGLLRSSGIHTAIQGYWMEFPGSPATQWISSDKSPAWRY